MVEDNKFGAPIRIKETTRNRLDQAMAIETIKHGGKRVYFDDLLDTILQNYEAANQELYATLLKKEVPK